MSGVGKLEAIWIKRARLGPMDPASRAQLVAGQGLHDNADFGRPRQVTLIEQEVFEAVARELNKAVEPSARRANLMVSSFPLANSHGRVLKIGECRIRIRGETKPCERMDRECAGLKDALKPDWRGGAWGQVLDDGEIAVGDPVRWLEERD